MSFFRHLNKHCAVFYIASHILTIFLERYNKHASNYALGTLLAKTLTVIYPFLIYITATKFPFIKNIYKYISNKTALTIYFNIFQLHTIWFDQKSPVHREADSPGGKKQTNNKQTNNKQTLKSKNGIRFCQYSKIVAQ